MSRKQTPERIAWLFWCGLCTVGWGRYGFEPPDWSRCPECLAITTYIPPSEQFALFGPDAEEIPVYDPEALIP